MSELSESEKRDRLERRMNDESAQFNTYPEEVKSTCLEMWAAYNRQKRSVCVRTMRDYLEKYHEHIQALQKHNLSFDEVYIALRHR